MLKIIFLILSFFLSCPIYATLTQQALPQPIQPRIISLAPNLTEMLFAIGAGPWVVGTSTFSNYPKAAQSLPKVGDAFSLDLEKLIALKPTVVVTLKSNQSYELKKRLAPFPIRLIIVNLQHILDIPRMMDLMGHELGLEQTAHQASQAFLKQIQTLQRRYSRPQKIKVFYELWDQPLITVGSHNPIQEAIVLCGGQNIYEDSPTPYPVVTTESVLMRSPELIIVSDDNQKRQWLPWSSLAAVKKHQLYSVSPDLLQRFSPRLLEGIQQLCEVIDQVH